MQRNHQKSVRFEMTRPRLQARARPTAASQPQQNAASIPDGGIRHKSSIGLYRDDGLAILYASDPDLERLRKKII